MIIVVLIILGLALGSFINALVWRLHEQDTPRKLSAKKRAELSITKGRSMCPHCHHTLAAKDLVPVLSWISLGGKCRYCKKPISAQYPIVELLTMVLFIVSYLAWPRPLTGPHILTLSVWLAGLILLVALALYDLKYMLLPHKLTLPLIGLGALQTIVLLCWTGQGGWHRLLDTVLAVAVAGGIFELIYRLSQGAWIGGGDSILGVGLGLLLVRPSLAFLMLFVASLIGLLAAAPGLIARKQTLTSRIPFGPCLIAATIVTVLWGQHVINWYLSVLQ